MSNVNGDLSINVHLRLSEFHISNE